MAGGHSSTPAILDLCFTEVLQLMRHCRKHLLLHLIPSPSGFFVAGLEGGGPRDEKSQRRRCISARFLSQRGIQSGGCILDKSLCALVRANQDAEATSIR